MSHTNSRWTQDTANPDLEIFVGATEFKDQAAVATFASAGAGLLTLNLATTAAGNFFANISAALKRTGVLATPALTQEQFGTNASQPGPSAVAGTSGPGGPAGYPPFTAAQLATLGTPATGAFKKGFQINSVDLIYSAATVNLALAQMGLTRTVFVDNIAPAVTNIIALGANGMPVAFRAQPYRFNIPVVTPAMETSADTELILNVKLTAGGGGTALFYGAVLKCSFNFN